MKKTIALLLTVCLSVGLCACGISGESTTQPTTEPSISFTTEPDPQETEPTVTEPAITKYTLGETVETDIVAFMLDYAEFAIALYDWHDQTNINLPKEYNAEEDKDNLNVASKGHTLVSVEMTIENLDRTSLEIIRSMGKQIFLSVGYKDTLMDTEIEDGIYASEDGWDWENNYRGITLKPQEKTSFRLFVDIPVEVDSLQDTFELTFNLPNSKGETEAFIYTITKEKIEEYKSKEIALEEALEHFTIDAGKAYFAKHLEDYALLTGDEISSILTGTKNMRLSGDVFSFENTVEFNSKGFYTYKYKSTKVDIPWGISNNNLIIKMSSGEYVCEVRQISETAHLLVCEGLPFGVIYS